MKRILITGSNGLLGQKLVYALRERNDVKVIATSSGVNRLRIKDGYGYDRLDITDREKVFEVFEKHKPDCVVNTAAMTNVDACEAEREKCFAVNVTGVKNIVDAASKHNIHVIHLSTDFVFDGDNGPYKEDDAVNPLSYYAWSKVEGENILQQSLLPWTIIRTIIIYGVTDDRQRSNIVLWTKNSLEAKQTINVIVDQFRSPTLAEDLAEACIAAAIKIATGIYHVSGKEIMSIFEIVTLVADYFQLDQSYIQPVTTEQLNQPAKRPPRTGFVLDKAMHDLGYKPHSFVEGLQIVEKQLQEKEQTV